MLFDGHDASQRLTVFDVGPATPETIAFFSQFKCRLYFADLFEEQHLWAPPSQDEQDIEPCFPSLDAYPSDELFDICLFWDFLNYLDQRALTAFNDAIRRFVHRTTRSHAFSTLNVSTTLNNVRYGIRQIDTLSVRNSSEPQPERHPHPQAEIKRLLPCLDIMRSRLLTDGRLEILLGAFGN